MRQLHLLLLLPCVLLIPAAVSAGETVNTPCPCMLDSLGQPRPLLPDVDLGTPEAYQSWAPDAPGPWLTCKVSSQGMYRISQPDLVAAGFSAANLVGRDLRMYAMGGEIAIEVSNDGPWSAGDHLQFFGEGFDGTHSDATTYWIALQPGSSPDDGLRMATRQASPIPGMAVRLSHVEAAFYNPRLIYRPEWRPFDEAIDHWCANVVLNLATTAFNLPIANPLTTPSHSAQANIKISWEDSNYSLNPFKSVNVTINGTSIGNISYKGGGTTYYKKTFDPALLVNGSNAIGLKNNGSGLVVSPLREFTITYERNSLSDGAHLRLPGATGAATLSAGRFNQASIRVYDIREAYTPCRLTGTTVTQNGGFHRVTFGQIDPENTPCYWLTTDSGITPITQLTLVQPGNLDAVDQQADHIIITYKSLKNGSKALQERREAQGYQSKIVLVEDIYNQFGYGIKDPAAIKNFLGYAMHHWQSPAPQFVVFIGDASYDPRNYKGLGLDAEDTVPTRFGAGAFNYASQEGWFGQVVGHDDLVDLSLGRLPVPGLARLNQILAKIATYEDTQLNAGWRSRANLVADDADTAGDFKARSLQLVSDHFTPSGFTVTSAYLDDITGVNVRNRILSGFDNGRALINYIGHGNTQNWAPEVTGGSTYIFDNGHAASLANSIPPVVPAFSCATGKFADDVQSLVEALLEQANGAVACISAASEAFEVLSAEIAHGFYEALLNQRQYRIGPAFVRGIERLNQTQSGVSELSVYSLFGDPATIFNPVINAAADSDADGMPDGWEKLHGLEPFQQDAQLDPDGDTLLNGEEYSKGGHPLRQDSDGDGLPDGWEDREGSALDDADEDLDGMLDGYEVLNSLIVGIQDQGDDPDSDGLTNGLEATLGTLAQEPDTDRDGLDDGEEVLVHGTDPLNPDSDGDGLPDGDEVRVFSTHPLQKDSNGDGLDDGQQVSGGFLNYGGPLGDPDADGLVNQDEQSEQTLLLNPDTDGDTLSDGDEVHVYGSNPRLADSDGDGLSDDDEVFLYGTSPALADSDGDHLPDPYELANALDPTLAEPAADIDNDGLLQAEEFLLGTLPTVDDSDNDGLKDGEEVNVYFTNPLDDDHDNDNLKDGEEVNIHGTNPKDNDSDNDTLKDGLEINEGTNPLNSDTDGDLMPDNWERSYGLNPTNNADDFIDSDSDGLLNIDELPLNTFPNDNDSDNDGLLDGEEVNTYGTHPRRRDSDFDGLNDWHEIMTYFTDPLVKDTDGDTMSDGWEVEYNLNPTNAADGLIDSEGDGLINNLEYANFTNPHKADTDNDGLTDIFEIANGLIPRITDRDGDGINDGDEWNIYGTNPNNRDTDGDGLRDGAEINTYFTNPLTNDTDGDLMLDLKEVQEGLDPNVPDAHLDPDNDGLNNGFELAEGTDPLDEDTDNDTLWDGDEYTNAFTNPFNADTDDDGLTDGAEVHIHNTSPTNPDTEGDRMPDNWEVQYSLNPLIDDHLLDPDGDLLNNLEEFQRGTHPRQADTDGDTLDDQLEIAAGSNPLLADSDNDGLRDDYEYQQGLDPLLSNLGADSDLDGLSDTDEQILGTKPLQRDTDNDGVSDGDEQLAGSDPLVRDTIIQLNIRYAAPNVEVSWASNPGSRYSLLGSTNLSDGFSPVTVNIPATAPTNTYTVTNSAPMRVYRVELE